jgi:hypothetical protein
MTWGEVGDRFLYHMGCLMFAVGASARLTLGLSSEQATELMLTGLGFALLADVRMRRMRQRQKC